MTVHSTTFSKDVYALFDTKSSSISRNKLTPQLALKAFQQMAQNMTFCKRNSESIAIVCEYITTGVLQGLIAWKDVSVTINIVVRYFGGIFNTDGAKDLTLTSLKIPRGKYSRLLIMHHALNLRERWKKNPSENVIDYGHLIPFLMAPNFFDDLYRMMTEKSFWQADLYSTDELRRAILQCQEWDYLEGFEACQRILNDRIDSIGAVLGELNFAVENRLHLVEAHCRSFFENCQFYIDKDEGDNKTYFSHTIPDTAPNLNKVFPSAKERRLFCNNYFVNNGLMPLDMQLESIEIVENKQNIEFHFKTYNSIQIPIYKIVIKDFKRSLFSFESSTLVLHGAHPVSGIMILGLLRLHRFIGIDFVRHQEVSLSLLQEIAKINPKLYSLRIIRCPLIDLEAKEAIPRLFPSLGLFSLNGGMFPKNIFIKFMALPLRTLMLSACIVEWPEDLSGLCHLHTLELTFINIEKRDLIRLFAAIKELKLIIMIGIKNFESSMLAPHLKSIEKITISADRLTVSDLEYFAEFSHLKAIFLEGKLSPAVEEVFNQLVSLKKLKVGYLGNL